MSLLLQATVLSVALSGLTVAVSVALSPSARLSVVLSNLTEVTATTSEATVTEQVAVLSPAFAVTVAVPAFTAVTLPPASTVATEASEVLQLTVLFVALDGLTVAVSVALSPSFRLKVVLSSETELTATAAGGDGGVGGWGWSGFWHPPIDRNANTTAGRTHFAVFMEQLRLLFQCKGMKNFQCLSGTNRRTSSRAASSRNTSVQTRPTMSP